MFSNPYFHVIISSLVVYIFIALAIRLFGKKEISQLTVIDLVFVLLISNAVQNAMVGADTSLEGGLLAALTLFLVNYIFKYLLYRFKGLNHILEGEPVILVSEGKIKDKNLRKVQLTTDELLEAIHEHGVSNIHDVNLAILEMDGKISIISNDYSKRSLSKTYSKNQKTSRKDKE